LIGGDLTCSSERFWASKSFTWWILLSWAANHHRRGVVPAGAPMLKSEEWTDTESESIEWE
jgi:hypothetical protein